MFAVAFYLYLSTVMVTAPYILSLLDKGLKLDTRADIEPYVANVDPTTLEEIHLGGNTIGVDASLALAEFLQKTQVLKVCMGRDFYFSKRK
jgi:Ran GTPase-activating protein 1